MAKYTIQKDSVQLLGNKVGMVVTFIDEVNGKEDVTCYHEVESTNEDFIHEELSKSALEYEGRGALDSVSPKLTENKPLKAEIKGL